MTNNTKEKPCLALPPRKNATSQGESDTRTDAPQTTSESTELALSNQDLIEIQEHDAALEAEWQNRQKIGTFGVEQDLANWYLRKNAEYDQAIETIKEQAAMMIRSIESRRRRLAWRWGGAFKDIIDRMLHSQGGKKRSVNLLAGRAGYRKSAERLTIVDPQKVLEWADFNCPEAIKREPRITPLKQWLDETGEVPPGTHLTESRDSFYPPIGGPELHNATQRTELDHAE